MSVFRRKTTGGETECYHYRFMHRGVTHCGVCEGCRDIDSARAYERGVRALAEDLARQRSEVALVENYRERLVAGKSVPIGEMWELAARAPSRRVMSDKERRSKLSRWNDFVGFLANRYPSVRYAAQVTEAMAMEYAAMLRDYGRHGRTVEYRRRGRGKRGTVVTERLSSTALSAETINRHVKTCREVFRKSSDSNPFAAVPMMEARRVGREAFSLAEIRLLLEDSDPLVRDIVCVGIHTGLRRGDICRLKWDDIDWDREILHVGTSKTKAEVSIPILPGLMRLLENHLYNMSDYVMPELAALYEAHPDKITRLFKAALRRHGLEGMADRGEGRRSASVRDIHSLRHTFCHLAGLAGIPIGVVQGIVGHMSPEMTMRYSAHSTAEDRAGQMERLRRMLGE